MDGHPSPFGDPRTSRQPAPADGHRREPPRTPTGAADNDRMELHPPQRHRTPRVPQTVGVSRRLHPRRCRRRHRRRSRCNRLRHRNYRASRRLLSRAHRPIRKSPTRYRMLEAIREFAAEQLHRSGEVDQTRARQFDYFVALARNSRRDEFFGPPNSETMAALDAEHDNIREALDRLIASRDGERAELLAGAMGTYWAERGHWGKASGGSPAHSSSPPTHARSSAPEHSLRSHRRRPASRASRRAPTSSSRQSRSAETTKRRISWPPPSCFSRSHARGDASSP